jgi:hypothetical protein
MSHAFSMVAKTSPWTVSDGHNPPATKRSNMNKPQEPNDSPADDVGQGNTPDQAAILRQEPVSIDRAGDLTVEQALRAGAAGVAAKLQNRDTKKINDQHAQRNKPKPSKP